MNSIYCAALLSELSFNTSFLHSSWFYLFIAAVIGAGLWWFFRMRYNALPPLFEKMPNTPYNPAKKYSPPSLRPSEASLLVQSSIVTQNSIIATLTDMAVCGKLVLENVSDSAKWYKPKRFRFTLKEGIALSPYEKHIAELLFTGDIPQIEIDLWKLSNMLTRTLSAFTKSVEYELFEKQLIDPLRYQHRKTSVWISIAVLLGGFMSFIPAMVATVALNIGGTLAIAAVLFIMGIVGLIMGYKEKIYTAKGYAAYRECYEYYRYLYRAIADYNPELPAAEAVTYGVAFDMNYRVTQFLKKVVDKTVLTSTNDEIPADVLSELIKGLQPQRRPQ